MNTARAREPQFALFLPNGCLKVIIATLTGQHWWEKGCGLGDIARISKISGPDVVLLNLASGQPQHMPSVPDPVCTVSCLHLKLRTHPHGFPSHSNSIFHLSFPDD